jgi:hypothetical protein
MQVSGIALADHVYYKKKTLFSAPTSYHMYSDILLLVDIAKAGKMESLSSNIVLEVLKSSRDYSRLRRWVIPPRSLG